MSECCIALFGGDGVDWEKVSCVAVVTAELDPALAVSGEREDLRLYRDLETACCCHNDDLQSAHWEQWLISAADPWIRPHALYKPRRVRTKQLRPYYLYPDELDSKCVLLIQLRHKQTWCTCLNTHYKIQTHPWVFSNTQQTSTPQSSHIEYTQVANLVAEGTFRAETYTLFCTVLKIFWAKRVVSDCVLMWLLKDVGVNLGSHFLWFTAFLSLMRVCVIIGFLLMIIRIRARQTIKRLSDSWSTVWCYTIYFVHNPWEFSRHICWLLFCFYIYFIV